MIKGSVTILDYNKNATAIVSAAGRISTTAGSADEIYELSICKSEDVNNKLISKVLSSGHNSVLEHININLSFNDVSVFVEQFVIEHRLASFTVKSRRYVDFGNAGYVQPDFSIYGECAVSFQKIYQEYMSFLFEKYNALISAGIPKEDARFILPYSFRSNFYCTVNAREFIHIVNEMVYGRGSNYPEIVLLGRSLILQSKEIFPFLDLEAKFSTEHTYIRDDCPVVKAGELRPVRRKEKVTLLYGSAAPLEVMRNSHFIKLGIYPTDDSVMPQDVQKMIKCLMSTPRKRELEQINYTFLFNHLSLSGITHLVRHRMQAVIVPEFVYAYDFSDYVMPKTIIDAGMMDQYKDIFCRCEKTVDYLVKNGFRFFDLIYFMLSGLTVPVMTTMNGRELLSFLQLRTCSRAQWEIRENSIELLKLLRKECLELFINYGPSCYVLGYCPEGRMCCGQMSEICERFKNL